MLRKAKRKRGDIRTQRRCACSPRRRRRTAGNERDDRKAAIRACAFMRPTARRCAANLLAVGYFLTRQPGVFRQGAAGLALVGCQFIPGLRSAIEVFAFHDNPLSWVDTQFPMLLSCNDCNCSTTACGFLQTCYLLRMNPQSWAEEQAARIAAEIKRLRRGINDAPRSGLRDRTTDLATASRARLSPTWNGRRKTYHRRADGAGAA